MISVSFSFRIVSRSPTAESDGDGVCPLFVPKEDEPADEPEGAKGTWELDGGLPDDDDEAVTGMDAGPVVRWGFPKRVHVTSISVTEMVELDE